MIDILLGMVIFCLVAICVQLDELINFVKDREGIVNDRATRSVTIGGTTTEAGGK